MNRNAVDADTAFALLRAHSQRSGQKLSDIAAAIVNTHLVLVPHPPVGKPRRVPRKRAAGS